MAARKRAVRATAPFDVETFLNTPGPTRRVINAPPGTVIFGQGTAAASVFYIQKGSIKLSVLSNTGREAVVAILSAGDFFGEGCLAGKPRRMDTATTITPSQLLRIPQSEMLQTLYAHPEFTDRFLNHLLVRNIRAEEDLVDQLFNSSEKRLARTLLLLARYGDDGVPERTLSPLSQETLAEMIGTTRSRVNFFMNKFRKLGFIEYSSDARRDAGVKINSSLLSVLLSD